VASLVARSLSLEKTSYNKHPFRRAGYSGDVWNVQPASRDHIWRTMKNPLGGGNGMVPHYSGTTLDAQARYAHGTKIILENYLAGKEQEPQNIIVSSGEGDYPINVLSF